MLSAVAMMTVMILEVAHGNWEMEESSMLKVLELQMIYPPLTQMETDLVIKQLASYHLTFHISKYVSLPSHAQLLS